MFRETPEEKQRRRDRDRERYQEMRKKLCLHCKGTRTIKCRGLCWTCAQRPDLRVLYPSTSKFGRKGTGLKAGPAPLPKAPTTHPPGSAGKLDVMRQRAAKSEQIFHPGDATNDSI